MGQRQSMQTILLVVLVSGTVLNAEEVGSRATYSEAERWRDIRKQLQLNEDKLSAQLRTEFRSYGSINSLVTLAILSLGVLLFDALNDALMNAGGGARAWSRNLGLPRGSIAAQDLPPGRPETSKPLRVQISRHLELEFRGDNQPKLVPREEIQPGSLPEEAILSGSESREVILPGPGLFGEYINSLLEIGLNMITVWVHGDRGTECGRRLLCEFNQRSNRQRSTLHSVLTYCSGFVLSLLLPEASPSDHLLAMRQGRRGADCLSTFKLCPVTL